MTGVDRCVTARTLLPVTVSPSCAEVYRRPLDPCGDSPGTLQVINSYISPFILYPLLQHHDLIADQRQQPCHRPRRRMGVIPSSLSRPVRPSTGDTLVITDIEADPSALMWLVSQDQSICENRSGSVPHPPILPFSQS
jgi:hypothetical protein